MHVLIQGLNIQRCVKEMIIGLIPYKLQHQVDFLEANKNFCGCFHNTEERYEDDTKRASFLYCGFPAARAISFKDLSFVNVIPTCSVVFRNNLFGKFPEWYSKLRLGDWTLHLLNAQYGDFWYIPRVMAVHRLHNKSTWMLQDAEKNKQSTIEAYDEMINGFANNKHFVMYLFEAKQAFIDNVNSVNKKLPFKRRVKNLIIHLVEKI